MASRCYGGFGCTWRQIRVLEVVEDTPGALRGERRVDVVEAVARCPQCGFKCRRVHDTPRQRSVRDLEVSGRRTTLVWIAAAGSCAAAATADGFEEHPEFDGRADAAPGAASGRGRAGDDDQRAVVRRHGVQLARSVNAPW